MTKYIAHIEPLNAEKIGTKAHGTATFEEKGDQLHIQVEMLVILLPTVMDIMNMRLMSH